MWRDIALNNRDALLHEISAYETQLIGLRKILEANDGDALEAMMSRAKNARDRWMAGELDKFRGESI